MRRTYLVECYWPGVTEQALNDARQRAEVAAGELRSAGRDVTLLCSVLVPSDEVAFCLFAGESRDGVEEASRRAELPFERVTECVTRSNRSERTRRA
jgi:uncharacterized protein DUF4242